MKNIAKSYLQPAFLICVAILAAAGGGKQAIIKHLGVQLTKKPIPLKIPLDQIDATALAPYHVVRKDKIENEDILEQLGTRDYLDWELEDTEVDEASPVRYCSLFITYYTGNPDRVPHIPDECHVGGGSQRLDVESIVLNIKGLGKAGNAGSDGDELENHLSARRVVFGLKNFNVWDVVSKYSVLYLFRTNGQYAGNRTETRGILGKNFFVKYSYFSKVEWQFHGRGLSGRISPGRDEELKASEKFLSVLLPVVERDHWPDWDKAKSEK